MATYDYFVGILRCRACAHVNQDVSTNMQTKLSKQPSLRQLTIGDSLDADWTDVCSAGYFKIAEPQRPDTVTILETWECPNCDKPFNWAQIGVVDGKIELIKSVELSADIVQEANYITDDCRFLLAAPARPETIVEALIEQLKDNQGK